jgi:endonuclease YncB( thermonuclease family)
MNTCLACAALAVLSVPGLAQAQKVTSVPSQDTLVVAGVGKVRLAGIAGLEPAVRLGTTGPPAPPRSGPGSPPPAIIGGRVNLSRNRGARDALRKLVLGKEVTLEFDDSGGRAAVPRVYAFLPDGTLVNAELLRQGLVRLDTSVPIARLDELKRIERDAAVARRGLWRVSPDKP